MFHLWLLKHHQVFAGVIIAEEETETLQISEYFLQHMMLLFNIIVVFIINNNKNIHIFEKRVYKFQCNNLL